MAKTFSEEQIRERARQIWDRNGHPVGMDEENWFQAECELEAEASAGEATQQERSMTAGG